MTGERALKTAWAVGWRITTLIVVWGILLVALWVPITRWLDGRGLGDSPVARLCLEVFAAATVVILWLPGAAYVLSRSLWLPIGIHCGWNFVQGPLLGLSVSGHALGGWRLVELQGAPAVTGGGVGPEGGVVATGATLLGIAVLLAARIRRRGPGPSMHPPAGEGRGEAADLPLARFAAVSALLLMLCGCDGLGIQVYRAQTGSMAPTIEEGDLVFIRTLSEEQKRSLRRGEIVMFRSPRGPQALHAKRIVALAGETVRVETERLLVNEKPVDEPYVTWTEEAVYNIAPDYKERSPELFKVGPVVVPEDAVYVLSDNRSDGSDSRQYGPIPRPSVVGVVLFVGE